MSEKRLFSMQAETELLDAFREVCTYTDQSQAQVVRRFMREYVDALKKNASDEDTNKS